MISMKKAVSTLLCSLIFLSVFTIKSFSSSAAEIDIAEKGSSEVATSEAIIAGGITGDCTWTLDNNGVLTISGYGSMGEFKYNGAPWYRKGSSITTLIIKDGVTNICVHAFYNCTSLTSVTIPDSVTSIGNYAFYSCTSLTSVTIPDSVTSIGNYAFYSCKSLTSVNIPESVTSIGSYAFDGCTSLTSVTIPNSVTSIGDYPFKYCISLTNIIVNSNNKNYASVNGNLYNKNKTELIQYAVGKTDVQFSIPNSVKRIGGYAFYSCTSLTSVTIPDSVTSIGNYAFFSCKSLTSVILPDNVTSIGSYAFDGCTSLTSVALSDSLRNIGDCAFYSCTSLTNVTLPDSVKSIGKEAFYGCYSLTKISIPASVTTIGKYAFYQCTNLSIAIIPESLEIQYYWDDGLCNDYFPKQTKIKKYAATTTISYNANGGIGAPKSQTKYTNEGIELSNSIPTKTGYTFIGWTEHLCSNKYYQPGSAFTENRNITLYAKWGTTCSDCKGEGSITEIITCKACNGTGNKTITCPYCSGEGYKTIEIQEICNNCHGAFLVNGKKCTVCNGRGYIPTYEMQVCTGCNGSKKYTYKDVPCSNCTGGICTNYIKCIKCNGKGNIVEVVNHKCEWVVTKPATAEQTGIKKKLCVVCGAVVESQIIPKITQYILGDVDGDGGVSIIDATCIQRHLAEIPVYSYNETAADADGDGEVTILDATGIQRYLAELPCFIDIGNPIS